VTPLEEALAMVKTFGENLRTMKNREGNTPAGQALQKACWMQFELELRLQDVVAKALREGLIK